MLGAVAKFKINSDGKVVLINKRGMNNSELTKIGA